MDATSHPRKRIARIIMGALTWLIIPKLKSSFGSPFRFKRSRAIQVSQPSPSPSLANSEGASTKQKPISSSSTYSRSLQKSSLASIQTRSRSPPPEATAQSVDHEKGTHQGGTQLASGPCCTIVHNDGKANYYALLLTQELVDLQRETIEACRKKARLTRKLANIDMKLLDESDQRDLQNSINETESGEEACRAEDDLKPVKLDLKAQRDAYLRLFSRYSSSEANARSDSQRIIEQALQEADLLNLPEEQSDSTLSAVGIQQPDHVSLVTFQSNSTTISIEELLRRSVRQEMEEKAEEVYKMKTEFDQRYAYIETEQAEYEQAVLDKTCELARSGFDRFGVKEMQRRTGNFIWAEREYEEVKDRARDLGILGNLYEQESRFVDDDDDGYRESLEAATINDCNRDLIEAWAIEVSEAQTEDIESPSNPEFDEWDAKSIALGDSISVFDYTRNGSRIDRWQRICGRKD